MFHDSNFDICTVSQSSIKETVPCKSSTRNEPDALIVGIVDHAFFSTASPKSRSVTGHRLSQ